FRTRSPHFPSSTAFPCSTWNHRPTGAPRFAGGALQEGRIESRGRPRRRPRALRDLEFATLEKSARGGSAYLSARRECNRLGSGWMTHNLITTLLFEPAIWWCVGA